MKDANKSKKISIGLCIVFFIVVAIFLIFKITNKSVTLSCEEIQEDENSKLATNILIEKIGKDIHIGYTGNIEFFVADEFAYNFMSIYVQNQVSKLREVDEEFAKFEELNNQIKYEFNFNMSVLGEAKVKELLGIYSHDMEELRKHFESGGAVCEEI